LYLNLHTELWTVVQRKWRQRNTSDFWRTHSLCHRGFPHHVNSDVSWGLISEKALLPSKTPLLWVVWCLLRSDFWPKVFPHWLQIGVITSMNHLMHSKVWLPCKDFITLTYRASSQCESSYA
jgi:hypothetical protein